MYCDADLAAVDEDLAKRVYAYFIFRLRQPADAERLTRLTFERIREAENMGLTDRSDTELPVFTAARAVISENPRPRNAIRVDPRRREDETASTGLSDSVAMAIGRLHGRERDALALRFGADLSIGEISELLDRTPADVKQRLARGTRMLLDLGVLPKEGPKKSSAAQRPRAGGAEQGEQEKE
jgi:DNA-directed RNA polymerase specialized sigma24 family protein